MLAKTVNSKVLYDLAKNTSKIIESNQAALQHCKWSDGESNTDTDYSRIACESSIIAWEGMKIDNDEFQFIELSASLPDINCTFSKEKEKISKKIELKSSKSTKMPGSTIKKLDINMPLIYCLRPKNKTDTYKIKCSLYHQSMGENKYDLFQDRTPRPIINFDNMDSNIFIEKEKNAWIEHYSNCAINRCNDFTDDISWQDTLVKNLKKQFIDDFIKKTSIEEFEKMKNILMS
jgi:hypothetical protein